jgi:hypothetical protein
MSLTSYRAAPPRVTNWAPSKKYFDGKKQKRRREGSPDSGCFQHYEWVLKSRWLQSLATTYSSIA